MVLTVLLALVIIVPIGLICFALVYGIPRLMDIQEHYDIYHSICESERNGEITTDQANEFIKQWRGDR